MAGKVGMALEAVLLAEAAGLVQVVLEFQWARLEQQE
jgi:hypothetical protein